MSRPWNSSQTLRTSTCMNRTVTLPIDGLLVQSQSRLRATAEESAARGKRRAQEEPLVARLTTLRLLLLLAVFLMSSRAVMAQGQLLVSPASYSINYEIGGPLPPLQPPISVTSSGAPLNFTASTSGESWLTISPLNGTTPASIGVTVSVSGLPVGNYSSTMTISTPGEPFAKVAVKLSITEPTAPTIWVNPGSLSFDYQIGLNLPAAQTLSVTSYPTGQTISAKTSGEPWLSVGAIGNGAPASVSVTVNPAGLGPGTYQGKVSIISSTVANSPVAIPVTLTVSLPQSISFVFQLTSPPPAQICFPLTSTPSGASFSASASIISGGSWLSVTPASGVTPANVCILSSPIGMSLGQYSGTVTITGATPSPLIISVTLTVANGPILSVSPQSLSFVSEAGGSPPAAQSVSVTSDIPTTGVPLNASVSVVSGGDWLAVSPAASSTPGTFSVSIKPITLAPGAYTGSVLITSSTASNSPVKIPVTLNVPDIRLSVLPAMLAFPYQIGCNAPNPLSLSLSSQTAAGLPLPANYTAVATSAGWLSINSNAGTTPGAVTVSANTNGMSPGTYNGTVTVASASAANSPQVVPVLLMVSSPGLSLSSGSLTFNYQMGSAALSPSPISISSCGAPLDFKISVPPVGWVSVDTPSGTAPATANISVNAANLAVGTYKTTLTISSSAAGSSQYVPVTLVVRNLPTIIASPSALSFYYERGFQAPSVQILSISAGTTNFAASVSVSSGGKWLSIDNTGGLTPASLGVSVQPYSLAPGTYSGTVSITSFGASNSLINIPVTLTVATTGHLAASPASLSFSTQVGSPISQSQTITVSSTGDQLGFTTSFNGGGWLSLNPTPHASTGTVQGGVGVGSGQVSSAPVLVSVSANTTGLAAGTYSGSITIRPDIGTTSIKIPVTLTIRGNHLRIPQVADGNGWKTTIVLVNTDSDPAPFTISFRNAAGSPVSIPLISVGPVTDYSDVIPVGGSRTIETQGTASNLIQGWAEVVAGKSINGTAIFRQHAAGSVDTEGAVPLKTSAGTHFLVPFDNTQGFVTAMAMLNPDSAQTAHVSVTFRDENGQLISTGSLVLVAGTRQAFVLSSQFPEVANLRGVAEFSSPVEVSALGLRASPRYTLASIEPIDTSSLPDAGTTSTISQIADGGDWQTTIILVNTGSAPAPVSLRFTQPTGNPWALSVAGTGGISEYSDVIPAGGSRIIETAGTAPTLSQGWGQVITSGSVAGTAIFRQRLSAVRDAEGAVPLSLSGIRQFVLPFNNTQGFVTAMALANQDPVQSTAVTVTLRDQNGTVLGNGTVNLAPSGRSAFVVPAQFPETVNVQGVAEFSSNADLSALGLRYNPIGSFTSMPPISQ